MVDYQYEIFISYPRVPLVTRWVREYFHPLLVEELPEAFPPDMAPSVFVDWNVETGVPWPEELASALGATRCLLPVWTPSYFRSAWCRAELDSMVERERLLGLGPATTPKGLVCPIVFRDGEFFPQEARNRNWLDFRPWARPYGYFSRSQDYVEFAAAVESLAQELAQVSLNAPAWSSDWPTLRPPAPKSLPASLPRLR